MSVAGIAEVPRRVGRAGDRLLDVRGLQTSFHTRDGVVRAVTGVDFHVDRGEILGLVGESGCGKTVTALSILGLIAPPGRIEAGQILFDNDDLRTVSPKRLRKLRGERISMIFQQPQSSLNPVYDVGARSERCSRSTAGCRPDQPATAQPSCSGWSGSRIPSDGWRHIPIPCREGWPNGS